MKQEETKKFYRKERDDRLDKKMNNTKGSGLRGKYTKEEIARRYLKKLK